MEAVRLSDEVLDCGRLGAHAGTIPPCMRLCCRALLWMPKGSFAMAYTSWRGVVGCVKPTMRPGGIEELIRILPEGVCLLPLFLDIRKGTVDEFKRAVEPYEPLVARLAEAKVDLIHPEG